MTLLVPIFQSWIESMLPTLEGRLAAIPNAAAAPFQGYFFHLNFHAIDPFDVRKINARCVCSDWHGMTCILFDRRGVLLLSVGTNASRSTATTSRSMIPTPLVASHHQRWAYFGHLDAVEGR